MDDVRAMLDDLMGRDRNRLPNERTRRGVHFYDPHVCKYYICGFCPNELFTNTKSDLGPCSGVHDDGCRTEFMKLSLEAKKKYGYEVDFTRHLERLVNDLDRKIKKGLERLEHQDDRVDLSQLPPETQIRINEITQHIQELVNKVEALGEEGKVEEAQAMMVVIDQQKKEKEQLIQTYTQEKRMKVCEVCGAFLVIGDTEKRTQSHLEGKQHCGYQKIRDWVHEWNKNRSGGGEAASSSTSSTSTTSTTTAPTAGSSSSSSSSLATHHPHSHSHSQSRSRSRSRDRDRDHHRDTTHRRDHHDHRDRGRHRRERSRSHSRSASPRKH